MNENYREEFIRKTVERLKNGIQWTGRSEATEAGLKSKRGPAYAP
jgi:hypothetical protein